MVNAWFKILTNQRRNRIFIKNNVKNEMIGMKRHLFVSLIAGRLKMMRPPKWKLSLSL